MKKFPLKEFLAVIKYPVLFMVICWALFLADLNWNLDLYRFGISPRTVSGLKGILFAPMIHGSWSHIINNTLPVLVLGSLVFYFYKPIAWQVVIWIYFISCIWLWVGGRNFNNAENFHFGASILIYGFATFLFFSGVFRKHRQLMVVSALVAFLYGSITYGIFPFDKSMSWEGHLFGAISGILVAYNYRKEGPQQPKYQWPEEEIDLEAIYNEQLRQEEEWKREQEKQRQEKENIHITYTFIPKEKKDDDKL